MVRKLSSGTSSITISSGGSTGSKPQFRPTGRGGSGNVRRRKVKDDASRNSTATSTRQSRAKSAAGSIKESSLVSTLDKPQFRPSGRGGSGNIRRRSVKGDGMPDTPTRLSGERTAAGDKEDDDISSERLEEIKDDVSAPKDIEDMKDGVIAPRGLELDISDTIGSDSIGRGGLGNIHDSRRLLLIGDIEQLAHEEQEILAAYRTQKHEKESAKITTYGRGGLGNLRGGVKSRNPSDIPSSPIKRRGRRLSSLVPRKLSISSVEQGNKTEEESIITIEPRRRGSLDSFSNLFLEDSPPSSPSQPTASISQLPQTPQHSTTVTPSLPAPVPDSPPSPLFGLRPLTPNELLNVDRRLPLRPSTPTRSRFTVAPVQRPPMYIQKRSAGGGAEWRLVTRVREERRGSRKYITEDPVWELFSKEDVQREKQEAYEMKMKSKWIEKGKKAAWISEIGDGYVSEPI